MAEVKIEDLGLDLTKDLLNFRNDKCMTSSVLPLAFVL
jgi:hypothetical protein